MRYFAVIDIQGDREIADILQESSFVVLSAEEFEWVDRFFCSLTKDEEGNDNIWKELRPHLMISESKAGEKSYLYSWQEFQIAGKNFFIGTLSEREFIVPKEWYSAYGLTEPDERLYGKAVISYCYMYLLAELIDETAEWCGHMSSVVHRM